MRIREDYKRQRDEGVVPLINIVFLLLVFFLLVGTLAPSPDLPVEYAATRDSPSMQAPSQALYVSAGGTLSYGGAPVALTDLPGAIAETGAVAAEAPFPVVLDRALPAREIGAILDALSQAGIARVQLVTRRKHAS